MPLYEYRCAEGHRFELIRKFSDPPLEKCPTCGAAVEKLISSPAFQFKGTGWYVTDYAKKDQPSSSGDAKSDAGANDPNKNEKADKAAEKSEKNEKGEKGGSEKSDKGEKSDSSPATKPASTDSAPAAAPAAPKSST